ncbi:MAG: hypothetical protein HY370_06880 [Proteobacteria bacterium]|nr:hypothetical protein [Pseudomonadota bacterium]
MEKPRKLSAFEVFAGACGIGFSLLGMTVFLAPDLVDKPFNQISDYVHEHMTSAARSFNPNVPAP